jgi:hypothetical protein
MENWIEERANKINEAEALAEQRRQWQLHVATVIRAEYPSVLEKIARAVESDTMRFNEKFPADQTKRIDPLSRKPNGFIVRRTYYPSFTLDVQFNHQTLQIEYRSTIATRDSHNSGPSGALRFHVAETGDIYIDASGSLMTPEEASEFLLSGLIR